MIPALPTNDESVLLIRIADLEASLEEKAAECERVRAESQEKISLVLTKTKEQFKLLANEKKVLLHRIDDQSGSVAEGEH